MPAYRDNPDVNLRLQVVDHCRAMFKTFVTIVRDDRLPIREEFPITRSQALYRVGQYSAEKNDHSTVLVVGNEPKQYWKKLFSLAKTEELVKLVTAVADSS